MKSYAEALQKLNEADRSREKMSAVDAFASAAAADPDGTFLSLKDSDALSISTPGHGHLRGVSGVCMAYSSRNMMGLFSCL